MTPGLKRFVWGSLALHVGVFIAITVVTSWDARPHSPPQTVLTTKLVRLGKERPKELLPRKVTPPPEEKPAPALEKEPAKPTPTPSEPVVSAKDRIKELSKVSQALERLKSQEEPEGHESGVADGEETDISKATLGSAYATEVYRCLKSHYAVLGVEQRAVRDLNAVVFLRVGADGRFLDHRIERSSGVQAFDQAVERAVARCGKVSAPPVSLREQLKRDGFEVVFTP